MEFDVLTSQSCQILNLLKLSEELMGEVEAMGDYWERRLITERMLRNSVEITMCVLLECFRCFKEQTSL